VLAALTTSAVSQLLHNCSVSTVACRQQLLLSQCYCCISLLHQCAFTNNTLHWCVHCAAAVCTLRWPAVIDALTKLVRALAKSKTDGTVALVEGCVKTIKEALDTGSADGALNKARVTPHHCAILFTPVPSRAHSSLLRCVGTLRHTAASCRARCSSWSLAECSGSTARCCCCPLCL
jgi:hypothetical protein